MCCGFWDAGAIPAASTFSELASSSDKSRHVTSQAASAKEVATHDNEGESRQEATASDMPRPLAATKSATTLLADDPDLAVVLAAWPDLPLAVRAAVVATVKAASV